MGTGNCENQACIDLARAKNAQTPVNKLPNELLSNIFIIVGTLQRARRLKMEFVCHPMPQLAVQVCSYWRKVAIDTPSLWTHIHIDRPPLHQLAALCISRAGPLLLEIELDLTGSYWVKTGINPTRWEKHIDYLPDLFAFLTTSGAHAGRWKSLVVRVKTPRLAFEIIHVLRAVSAPALEFFSCKWITGDHYRFNSEEKDSVEDLTHRYNWDFESFRLPSQCFPNLRSAELIEIPWGFAIDRPPSAALFRGLVSLRLTAGFETKGFKCFHGLFSANPRLEELYISSGKGINTDDLWYDGGLYDEPELDVPLPRLHQLELRTYRSVEWIGPTLRMIDASTLQRFALTMHHVDELEIVDVFEYLTAGRGIGYNGTHAVAKPMFPSLWYLDVNIASGPGILTHTFGRLLSKVPLVCHLIMPNSLIDLLGEEPYPLSGLSRLEIRDLVPPQLGDILRKRLAAGVLAVETVGLVAPGLMWLRVACPIM